MTSHETRRSSTQDRGPGPRGAAESHIGKQTLVEQIAAPPVQRRADPAAAADAGPVHQAAAQGVATAASPLPHGDAIQRAFGRHDVSAVQAHTGSDAAASARAMGAQAYATGTHVVLGDGATDLHTVAHEAAHVVQQRAGVQLKGGVGEAGDSYERHADEVADRVVQGKSAESVLDAMGPGRGAVPAGSVQRVAKEPRRTEGQVLDQMASGTGSLSADHRDALIDKMDKDQTFERARAIAAQIEAESERLVSALPAQQQDQVRAAIRNYVASSTAIQNDVQNNPNAPGQAVLALDAALVVIQAQIANTDRDRIVYRSVTYDAVTDIPYGQANAAGHIINVGDVVGHPGFASSSEHRQFVLGKEQTGQVRAMLKLAIHGTSGVPIAIDFPIVAYSNSNQQAIYNLQQSAKNRLTQVWDRVFGAGPRAGQAEVLFPRGIVFEVKQIQRSATTVSVVLEEVAQAQNAAKNMKDGSPL
ncbi:MAG TPA: DUF4157 domain-containing protein [Kofleriaceae bacterium]|jgi:hypothetical protein|nr:DUF4157 domain-containing protein [Kofleriaceae bacterium]